MVPEAADGLVPPVPLELGEGLRQGLAEHLAALGQAGALGQGGQQVPLSPALQEQAAAAILKNDLSVRQTEQLVKRLQAAPKLEKKASPAVNYVAEAERQLSDRLGRACHIAHGRKKGRVEIEYYGVDDLNNLLEALGRLGK